MLGAGAAAAVKPAPPQCPRGGPTPDGSGFDCMSQAAQPCLESVTHAVQPTTTTALPGSDVHMLVRELGAMFVGPSLTHGRFCYDCCDC